MALGDVLDMGDVQRGLDEARYPAVEILDDEAPVGGRHPVTWPRGNVGRTIVHRESCAAAAALVLGDVLGTLVGPEQGLTSG